MFIFRSINWNANLISSTWCRSKNSFHIRRSSEIDVDSQRLRKQVTLKLNNHSYGYDRCQKMNDYHRSHEEHRWRERMHFRVSYLPNIIFPKISRYRTENIVMQSLTLIQ